MTFFPRNFEKNRFNQEWNIKCKHVNDFFSYAMIGRTTFTNKWEPLCYSCWSLLVISFRCIVFKWNRIHQLNIWYCLTYDVLIIWKKNLLLMMFSLLEKYCAVFIISCSILTYHTKYREIKKHSICLRNNAFKSIYQFLFRYSTVFISYKRHHFLSSLLMRMVYDNNCPQQNLNSVSFILQTILLSVEENRSDHI